MKIETTKLKPGDLVKRGTETTLDSDNLHFYLIVGVERDLKMVYLGDPKNPRQYVNIPHFAWYCRVWRNGELLVEE